MRPAMRAWNPWWESGEVPNALRGRRRRLTEELTEAIDLPHVIVLSGIRRSGKTTLLYQLVDHLLTCGVDPQDIAFLNLEDPAFDADTLDTLIDGHRERDTSSRQYVFLDEIQTRPGWERSILPRYERKEPVKFVVSGSSADLARGEHGRLLTGRTLEWLVRPLDFDEYASFHRQAAEPRDRSHSALFNDHYLQEGGFPEVQWTAPASRRRLLQQYFDQIIGRDLAGRSDLDVEKARRIGVYLAETFARPHTRRALANATGIGSHDTLQRYLDALRRVYLVEPATRATGSPKPDLAARSPLKFYWTDIGLRNALVRDPDADKGRQVENVVAMALAARHGKIEYWWDADGRTEVDFVITREDGKVDAYEVWYDQDGDVGLLDDVPSREWRGFDRLRAALPARRRGDCLLLSSRTAGQRGDVRVMPVVEWLERRPALHGPSKS